MQRASRQARTAETAYSSRKSTLSRYEGARRNKPNPGFSGNQAAVRRLSHVSPSVQRKSDSPDGSLFENLMFRHKNQPGDDNARMSLGTELRARYFEHYRRAVQKRRRAAIMLSPRPRLRGAAGHDSLNVYRARESRPRPLARTEPRSWCTRLRQ